MIMALIYIILTLSLNLIAGYTGYVSFAHPAFYCIGAYTSALLLKYYAIPFPLILLLAGLLPLAISIAIGYVFLSRVWGFAFCMVTLAFNAAVGLIMTSGLPRWIKDVYYLGVFAIPHATIFTFELTTEIDYYYFFLCITLVSIYFMFRLVNSKFGRAMTAIRQNEMLAESVGINTVYYKVLAFSIGAFFAGIAGGFIAPYATFVGPDLITPYYWVLFFTMLFTGGSGTFLGPIIGGITFTFVPELLRFIPIIRSFPQLREALLGAVLILTIIFFPKGVGGYIRDVMYRRKAIAPNT